MPDIPPASSTAARLLVVDDDEHNRDTLSRRLIRRGYTVDTAADGTIALQAIRDTPYDLILLDVMMPGISGIEVLKQLRLTLSPAQLPIIMATANDRSEDVVAALDAGANDYVTKPLDFAIVTARVQTHVLLKQSIDQIRSLEEDLLRRNAELEASADRLRQDLLLAAKVQETMLPRAVPNIPGAKFAWAFRPCEQLAGDGLNIFPINDHQVGFYVLDVSGHGVAASLLSVAAARQINHEPAPQPASAPVAAIAPADIATQLDQRFPFTSDTRQFVTLFYALLDTTTRTLTYTSAGHPPPIWISAESKPRLLEEGGLPIGLNHPYEQYVVQLQSGDRIYTYSDGMMEAMNAEHELFGIERLIESVSKYAAIPLNEAVENLLNDVAKWRDGLPQADDVSIIACECL